MSVLPAPTSEQQPPVRRYEPLVPAAGAFLAGILAGESLGGPALAWCIAAAVAAALWAVFYFLKFRAAVLLVPLLLVLAAAGAARYRAAVDPPVDDVARLITAGPRLVTLEGTVVRSARQSQPPADVFLPGAPPPDAAVPRPGPVLPPADVFPPRAPFYIRSTLVLKAERACVDGRWVAARGDVYTTVREKMPAPANASPPGQTTAGQDGRAAPAPPDAGAVPVLGDRVQVLGTLLPMGRPANPGSFDGAAYLRQQGVRACLSTGHWEAVRVVEPGADRLRWAVGAIGRWAVARLEPVGSAEGKAVAAAILFGRRDLLDFEAGAHGQEIERAFINTGTAHFLAVSGFNVGLAAAVVLLLTRLPGLKQRPTAVLVAAVVLAYVLMTEMAPPILRAAILVWVVCLGWFLGREAMGLNSLAAGAMLVLAVRPGDLFSLSFQLSFAVVLGMMLLVEKVERTLLLRRPEEEALSGDAAHGPFSYRHYFRRTAALSLAASLVAVPLAAYRFHVVGWLSPLATFILSPLMFGLQAAGMALVALGWRVPVVIDLLAALPDGLSRAIVRVVTALARIPGAYLYTPEISWGWLVVAYGLLAAWVWRERLGVSRRRLAIAALAAAAAFVWTGGHTPPAAVRATFLAVGDGNCNVLELPNGRVLLYDAGSALSHVQAAEKTIAPALWSRRIDRVDAVFFSHAHFDHFKDVLPLVERFGVRQVFVPPTFVRRRLRCDDMVVEALLARGVRVEFMGAGDRLAGTGNTEIAAVWPRGPASQTRAINDGSLALVVADRGRRLLLAGDLEPAGQAALAAAAPDLRADVLLWPHHGHEPEAVGRLATHLGARVLVASAGRPYVPRPEPDWAKQHGIACYHTGEHGAVTVELRPQGLRVETFADGAVADLDLAAAGEDDADADD